MVHLMRRILHFWPALLLLAFAGLAYALGLQHFLSFHSLGRQQATLRGLVAANPVIAPAAYMAAYAAAVALSIPGGVVLSVAGGVLFGLVAGSAYAIVGAWLGANLVFLAARYALGNLLERRAGPLLARVRPGLQRDGFSYLLALRLLPIVPFWLVNLAPALAGMRLAPYAAATLLGIGPATIVFVSLGAGFGDALSAGQQPDLSVIFRPSVLLPLLGLAVLALLPVGWRRWKQAHA